MSYSYRIIYKNRHPEFKKLLSKGTPTTNGYYLSNPVPRNSIQGALRKYAEEHWNLSQLVWRRLLGGEIHPHSVLEITTPNGKYIIMRNGNNIGAYNYAVLDKPQSELHFCQNSLEAVELVEILGATRNQLPLLVGQVTNKRLLLVLERRLRHAA